MTDPFHAGRPVNPWDVIRVFMDQAAAVIGTTLAGGAEGRISRNLAASSALADVAGRFATPSRNRRSSKPIEVKKWSRYR